MKETQMNSEKIGCDQVPLEDGYECNQVHRGHFSGPAGNLLPSQIVTSDSEVPNESQDNMTQL